MLPSADLLPCPRGSAARSYVRLLNLQKMYGLAQRLSGQQTRRRKYLKWGFLMKTISIVILVAALAGCTSKYASTVTDFVAAEREVQLGMTQEQVATILEPTQDRLAQHERKRPDRYMKDGVQVDIVYYRSGWQSDGLTTDDEFTPYLFNNNELVAIGWSVLGGPNSTGQATSSTTVKNTTIVY